MGSNNSINLPITQKAPTNEDEAPAETEAVSNQSDQVEAKSSHKKRG